MFLLCYTRMEIKGLYDVRLAKSVHFAISEDGRRFLALNNNSGILYGKASENADGSLNAKCLDKPVIVKNGDKGYRVLCLRCDENGNTDSEMQGRAAEFTTKDFISFSEMNPIEMSEYEHAANVARYNVRFGAVAHIEGALLGNVIEIPENIYERLMKKLGGRVSTEVKVDKDVKIENRDDIDRIKCQVIYSDGTCDVKKVKWDTTGVEYDKAGSYRIRGKVLREHFEFPIAINRADPCVGRWNGKYYFIATNDADGNHSLYIREADSLAGLKEAEEVLLLDSTTYKHCGNLLWAPEFHEINGKLYIFHACTPEPFFEEESHIMCLKDGGNPMKREDWSEPKRVVKADGSNICEAGNVITLDMTCFEWQGEYYAVWSERRFKPKDLGAWLKIAKLNSKEPWKLASEPAVLSKPEYGWANNHTFVDEGPFALIRDDRLFLTFSSAAVDESYVVGLLQTKKGQDILKAESWVKTGYPILSARSVEGEYGTGHNAYVTDDDGVIWNTYHARPGEKAPRSTGFRRVHFDIDGEPVLDLTEDRDLTSELENITTTVIIEDKNNN